MTTSLRPATLVLCKQEDADPLIARHLNLRIRPQVRELIDRAAELAGKNRTDFVLDAACRAAENTLLDHTLFMVGSKAYRQFLVLLDAPPKPNRRLLKTMRTRAPWG